VRSTPLCCSAHVTRVTSWPSSHLHAPEVAWRCRVRVCVCVREFFISLSFAHATSSLRGSVQRACLWLCTTPAHQQSFATTCTHTCASCAIILALLFTTGDPHECGFGAVASGPFLWHKHPPHSRSMMPRAPALVRVAIASPCRRLALSPTRPSSRRQLLLYCPQSFGQSRSRRATRHSLSHTTVTDCCKIAACALLGHILVSPFHPPFSPFPSARTLLSSCSERELLNGHCPFFP
jgi:hypothetical protein